MTIFLAQLRKIFIYKVASLDLKTRQIEKFKMYSLRAETKSMISQAHFSFDVAVFHP